MSMREWDIPFEELKIGEVIGTGRFGTVYRGCWHGDVAVKVLNMSYLKDEQTLEQFRNEVSTFRKTRHENVILFMGACMQPPKLAIVTSLSKGMTLYTHIHLRKDKFNMNKTTIVAQQISQVSEVIQAVIKIGGNILSLTAYTTKIFEDLRWLKLCI
jgi:kinase suppressor of Ras 2